MNTASQRTYQAQQHNKTEKYYKQQATKEQIQGTDNPTPSQTIQEQTDEETTTHTILTTSHTEETSVNHSPTNTNQQRHTKLNMKEDDSTTKETSQETMQKTTEHRQTHIQSTRHMAIYQAPSTAIIQGQETDISINISKDKEQSARQATRREPHSHETRIGSGQSSSNTPEKENSTNTRSNVANQRALELNQPNESAARPTIQQLIPQYESNMHKHNEAWGASINNIRLTTFRIYFQNINGLEYKTNQSKWEPHLQYMQEKGIKISGLAETNTNWNHKHIKKQILASTNHIYDNYSIAFTDNQFNPR
jgi:hypothetical protein